MANIKGLIINGDSFKGAAREDLEDIINDIILENDKKKYPIGCLEFNVSGDNPSNYLGFGTWELWGSGRVPIGVDTTDSSINTAEKQTGSKTTSISHTHSIPSISVTSGAASGNTGSTTLNSNHIPAHNHTFSGYTNDAGWHEHNTWNVFSFQYSPGGYTSTSTGESADGRGNPTEGAGTHNHYYSGTTSSWGSSSPSGHTHSLNSHTHSVSVSSKTSGS